MALVHRPYTIAPVVARHEVASWIADEWHPQLAHHLQHVAAEAHLVRGRMPRLVDPAVDRPPQVLDECSKYARIDLPNAEIRIQDDASGCHKHTTPFPRTVTLRSTALRVRHGPTDFNHRSAKRRNPKRQYRTTSELRATSRGRPIAVVPIIVSDRIMAADALRGLVAAAPAVTSSFPSRMLPVPRKRQWVRLPQPG